jgi:regulatory protein
MEKIPDLCSVLPGHQRVKMPEITGLRAVTRRQGYVQVSVDGEILGMIKAEDADRLGLREHVAIDEAPLEQILALADDARARVVGERFVAFRPRTEQEVRQRLRRDKFSPERVESTVGWLVAQGLLDDRRFADMWVENRTAFSPRSPRLLQAELRRKGVERQVIDDVLAQPTLPDEADLALEAARGRARRSAGLSRDAFDRRLGGFLGRRGFSFEAVRSALDRLWLESGGAAHEDGPQEADHGSL